MKRRNFISNVLAGTGGALVLGLPGISSACTRSSDLSEMVTIPAGKFLMGTTPEQVQELALQYGYHPSWISSESPQKSVELPEYQIDRYPVTNKQYQAFCMETGYAFPKHWSETGPSEEILNHPVTFVQKPDSEAYAVWAEKRLPTEAEWEKAARGTDGRMFPWGDEFDPEALCWNRQGGDGITTDPVDAHPKGASPYGVMDMSGNVMEWCADGPEDAPLIDRAVKYTAFIKGGAWITTEIIDLRSAARGYTGAFQNQLAFYGFRCVKEVNNG
ncbi:MAG: SUMF1/EgtB/PvdO family nonheme iron enzyme [Bacteroidota bacterium]